MPFFGHDRAELEAVAQEHKLDIEKGAVNFTGNLQAPDSLTIDWTNEDNLRAITLKVCDLNKNRRIPDRLTIANIAGRKHPDSRQSLDKYQMSYTMSPLSIGDGEVVLRFGGKPEIKLVDKEKMIVSCTPGIQVSYLMHYIYQHWQLTLGASSLLPTATAIGVAAVGGFNTGNVPSMAALQQRIKIMRWDGVVEWLSPETDDDFDNYKHCHLGLLGTILEIELQAMPAKKMLVVDRNVNRATLQEEIRDGLFSDSEISRISIMNTPRGKSPESKDNENGPQAKDEFLVKTMRPLPLTTRDVNAPTRLGAYAQEFEVDTSMAIHMTSIEKHLPSSTKLFNDGIIATQLEGTKVSIASWPDQVLYLHAYPGANIKATDHKARPIIHNVDVLFRDNAKTSEKLLKAKKFTEDLLDEYAFKGEVVVDFAVYYRSICSPAKGTENSLAPTHHVNGERVFSIDIVFHEELPGAAEFEQRWIVKMTGPEFRGIRHPAKALQDYLDDENYVSVRNTYGDRFPRAMNVFARFYQKRKGDLAYSPYLSRAFRGVFELGLTPQLQIEQEAAFKIHDEPQQDSAIIALLRSRSSLNPTNDKAKEEAKEEPKTSPFACLPCFKNN